MEEIIEKVGNNIEEITFHELSDITYWFYEKYFENGFDSKSIKKLKEEYENDLLQNGIIQFYEFTSSSSQVSDFREVMLDFESLSKIKIGYDCHSEQFM
ncbi:hypothetical protein [Crocinitomix catalasitica]|uniref:hypothetical protein n=1 Tax=Crocinitomix catalasitica TaxID=184607 RepID=UPI0004892128|nr:hypothetical protein [Crocinitomix catalasitica]